MKPQTYLLRTEGQLDVEGVVKPREGQPEASPVPCESEACRASAPPKPTPQPYSETQPKECPCGAKGVRWSEVVEVWFCMPCWRKQYPGQAYSEDRGVWNQPAVCPDCQRKGSCFDHWVNGERLCLKCYRKRGSPPCDWALPGV